jgi:hypothetical protein
MNFKLWIESKKSEIGININDKSQPFTELILNGKKTIETRDSRSLDSVIGKRVGLIRTGVGPAILVGYATLGEPIFYGNREEFDKDWRSHRVGPESPFYIDIKGKWGYPIQNVERLGKPRLVTSMGIVMRKI